MAQPTKVVDEDEAYRLLFDEEWTYPQMVDLYREKYGIETTISMWSRFVKRVGGRRSAERFPLATPWVMHAKEPRNSHYRTGLRALAAIEQGKPVSEAGHRVAARLRRLLGADLVVDYDRDADAMVLVPRREGVDKWWIRDPFVGDDGEPVADFSHVSAAAVGAHFGL